MKKITYILLLFLTTTTIVAQTGEYKAGVGSLKDRTLGDYNVERTLTVRITAFGDNCGENIDCPNHSFRKLL